MTGQPFAGQHLPPLAKRPRLHDDRDDAVCPPVAPAQAAPAADAITSEAFAAFLTRCALAGMTTADGRSHLHMAVECNPSTTVLAALLRANPVAVKAVDANGFTPLHQALLCGASFDMPQYESFR